MEQRLRFQPAETVVFPSKPDSEVVLEILNDWEQTVIFKMKSTRPGVLKMRPVFGDIKPGHTAHVSLTVRGNDPNEVKFSSSDRFTVVLAPAPKKYKKVAALFKENVVEIRQQSMRKILRIKTQDKAEPPEKKGTAGVKRQPDGHGKEAAPEEPLKPEDETQRAVEAAKKPTEEMKTGVERTKPEEEDDDSSSSSCDCSKSHSHK